MDMVMLGHTQVLRRNFKFVTMLGFASTVMAAWEICLVLSTYVLIDGGTADMFWGFLVLTLGMGLVYASLAELASMSPVRSRNDPNCTTMMADRVTLIVADSWRTIPLVRITLSGPTKALKTKSGQL